jgi:hypothetical protein
LLDPVHGVGSARGRCGTCPGQGCAAPARARCSARPDASTRVSPHFATRERGTAAHVPPRGVLRCAMATLPRVRIDSATDPPWPSGIDAPPYPAALPRWRSTP